MKYFPKIIAPINSFEEIKILHDAGANEFYGGYIPPYWEKEYSLLCSPSGRTFKEAHIIEFSNLRKIIDYCKKNELVFSLTLNAPLYLPEQYPLLFRLIEEYLSAGGKNVIAADLGLILSLHEKKYPVILHLGTSAVVLNHFTAIFFKEMGIKRIVLERQLTIAEITKIVNCVPDVKFDVFILIGKCTNIEGLCTFLHDSPDRTWHCVENYAIEIPKSTMTEKNWKVKGEGVNISNIWNGIRRTDACGLCQIKKLIELKIHGFKIVGRGTNIKRKLRAIEYLKNIICISSVIKNEKKFYQEAHGIYEKFFNHKCSPELCYFPFEDL